MTYLIAQLWIYLLIALAIGVYCGWVVWGRRAAAPSVAAVDGSSLAELRAAHAQELAAARSIVAEHRSGAFGVRDADEIDALRAAHAEELAAARAIVAQHRQAPAAVAQSDGAASVANGADRRAIEALRAAHAQELAAARAIVSDFKAGAFGGAIEISKLRSAHEQELAAARAIMAEYAAKASTVDLEPLTRIQRELSIVGEEREALRRENEALRARIDVLDKRRTQRRERLAVEIAPQAFVAETAVARRAPQAEAAGFLMRRTQDEPVDASERRPALFEEPPEDGGDDLKRIRGVGDTLEKRLHALGVYTYEQIASWTDEEVRWVDGHLRFKGRIGREQWIEQARALSGGGVTEFSKRVDAGDVYG